VPNEEKTFLRDSLIKNGFQVKGNSYKSGSEELEITSEQNIDKDQLLDFIKKYIIGNGLVFRDSAIIDNCLDVMGGEGGKHIIAYTHITLSERANYCRVSYRYLNTR